MNVRAASSRASKGYSALSISNLGLWQSAALQQSATNDVTSSQYHPTAQNYFVGLATKYQLANSRSDFPLTPPSGTFAGDLITFSLAGGVRSITVTSSAANAAGVITEVLIQKQISAARQIRARDYRTRIYHVFSGAGDSVTVSI